MAKGAAQVIGTQRCFLLSSDLLWKTPPWQRARLKSLELNAAFSFHPIFCGKHLHGKGRGSSHWNSTLLSPFIRSFVENTTMAKGAAQVIGTQRCFLLSSDLLWKTPPWQRA